MLNTLTPHKMLQRERSSLDIYLILYYVSLVFLLLCLIAFVIATPIDTIIQSKNTGQFWNTIIILGAYALTFITAMVIYVLRIVATRRSLNAIPHGYYVVQTGSIPWQCVKMIETELERCKALAEQARPAEGIISHPGMMRPALSKGGRLMDTPYEDVIGVSSSMIEAKAAALHPSFYRPQGMPLREYISFLQTYGMVPTPSIATEFVNLYERARFSGELMSELEFDIYMESCRKLLVSLRLPTHNSIYNANDGSNLNLVGPANDASSVVSNSFTIESLPLSRTSTRGGFNRIQWNPAYLLPGNEPDAFLETLTQISQLTTRSSANNLDPHYSSDMGLGRPGFSRANSTLVHYPEGISRVNSNSSVVYHREPSTTALPYVTTTASDGVEHTAPSSFYNYPGSITNHAYNGNAAFSGPAGGHHYGSTGNNTLSRFSSRGSFFSRLRRAPSSISSEQGSVIIRR
jgi:hypothetical protein